MLWALQFLELREAYSVHTSPAMVLVFWVSLLIQLECGNLLSQSGRRCIEEHDKRLPVHAHKHSLADLVWQLSTKRGQTRSSSRHAAVWTLEFLEG